MKLSQDAVKPILITGAALLLAAAFDVLFYRKAPGVSFPVFTGLTLTATFALARRFRVNVDRTAMVLSSLILALSAMVAIRASTVLVALDIAVCLYLFALLLGRFTGLSLRDFGVANYLRQLVGAPLQALRESWWVARELNDSSDAFRESRALRQTGRGIATTVPVLLLFMFLLSSADLVFGKYLADALNALQRLDFIEHALVLAGVSIILTGMFAYAFSRRSVHGQGEDIEVALAGRLLSLGFVRALFLLCGINIALMILAQLIIGVILIDGYGLYVPATYHASATLLLPLILTVLFVYIFYRYRSGEPGNKHKVAVASRLRRMSAIESSLLLGSLIILFLVFIILQFTCLFGGDATIATQGFTYAEYAHRGFFELIAVALLTFFVVWLTNARVDKHVTRSARLFKILAGTLILLVAIIMVSAFKRLSVYEAAYGYTVLRVYTQLFIVMLGAIFLVLFIKLAADRRESWLALRAFSVAIAFLIGMNIANVGNGDVGKMRNLMCKQDAAPHCLASA